MEKKFGRLSNAATVFTNTALTRGFDMIIQRVRFVGQAPCRRELWLGIAGKTILKKVIQIQDGHDEGRLAYVDEDDDGTGVPKAR
ncbi:hypothetical protein AgCh_008564 [Apium graveolens]